MMNKFLFFLIFYGIISCSSKKEFGYRINQPVKLSKDLTLSGFIIYNTKNGKHKFYINEHVIINDTNIYLKKRIRGKKDYFYIQPHDVKKKGRYYDFAISNEKDSQVFLNNINTNKKYAWIYINEEVFSILKDRNGTEYLTSKFWKPYIGSNPPL